MAVGIGRLELQQPKTTSRWIVCLSAAMLAASTITCSAGPCAADIGSMQVRVDAWLEAAAKTGPAAGEGTSATLHRQPTPGGMVAAEVALGKIPPEKAKALKDGMAQARAADQAGDKAACERALADVRRAIAP